MPRGKKYVPEYVKRALSGDVETPRLEELVSHFFRAAGGPKMVAKMLYEEFISAKAGSLMRQRILDMVLRATKVANDNSPNAGDLSLLTQEDLEREAAALILQHPEVEDAPASA